MSYADLGGQVTYVGTAVKVVGPPEQMIWTITEPARRPQAMLDLFRSP